MTIRMSCACGKHFMVKEGMEGKRVRCPAFQQPIVVPADSLPTEEEKAAAAKMVKNRQPRRAEEDDSAAEEGQRRPARRAGKKARKEKRGSHKALWIGLGSGVAVLVLVAVVVVILLARSNKKNNEQADNKGSGFPMAPQPGLPAPFLDQEKEVPPQLEWNREVISRRGGSFSFRVTSQGPFAVTVITDKGYKATRGGGRPQREDILLTVDSKGPTLEGNVTVPAGASYFIIENQTAKAARIHLQCFEGKKK